MNVKIYSRKAIHRYYPNQMMFNKVLDALIKSGEKSETDDL